MAPQSAAQSLQGHRPRPSASRSIVPAIPLPYMQKRKQNTFGPPKKVDEEQAATSDVATPTTITPVPSSPAAVPSTPKTPLDSTSVTISNHEASPATPAATILTNTDDVPTKEATDAQEVPEARTEEVDSKSPSDPALPEKPSSESRSTYNMPPPFVPAGAIVDHSKRAGHAGFIGQHPIHHPHPSNGSLVFGGYTESNNSSPAPPMSAGIPPYPLQDAGRPFSNGHMQQLSNGFASMGPPPQGLYGRHPNYDTLDNVARRQMGSFAPPDGYSPGGAPGMDWQPRYATHDASATPHSFHGSQSSAPNEQDASGQGFYNQFGNASGANLNGVNGHNEDARTQQSSRPKPRTGSQGVLNQGHYHSNSTFMPPGLNRGDDFDGLISYLQSQFGTSSFADCTLELRYSDDRAEPVRLPSHNIMLARSPALKNLMLAQVQVSGQDNVSLRTLLIESDDRYLRSDAFQMALQRLYGAPLLHPGVHPSMSLSSASDRFDLALGYVAAGHLLQMPPVVHRGIDVACGLINMLTVERAFDFALDGGLDASWAIDTSQHGNATYGPDVNMLLHNALNFVIASFPPNFELNSAVLEPAFNSRLPTIPKPRPTHSSRFSGLKFGDHTNEDAAAPKASIDPTTPASIISRILINLPFPLLKYVLESSRLGNVSGWATTPLRRKAMHAVVEEREARRIKVYEASTVDDPERYPNRTQWDAVGWKESVGTIGPNDDQSVLNREWVGFALKSN